MHSPQAGGFDGALAEERAPSIRAAPSTGDAGPLPSSWRSAPLSCSRAALARGWTRSRGQEECWSWRTRRRPSRGTSPARWDQSFLLGSRPTAANCGSIISSACGAFSTCCRRKGPCRTRAALAPRRKRPASLAEGRGMEAAPRCVFLRDLARPGEGTPLTPTGSYPARPARQVPVIDEADLAHTLHPPLRKWLLGNWPAAILPWRSRRFALVGRDLAALALRITSLAEAARLWAGQRWVCLAPLSDAGEACCPLTGIGLLLLFPRSPPPDRHGPGEPRGWIKVGPWRLGLRGAGLCYVFVTGDACARTRLR